jgi:hypothetical protein
MRGTRPLAPFGFSASFDFFLYGCDGLAPISHTHTHTGTYLVGDEVDVPGDQEHGGQAEEHDEQLGEEERVGLQHGRGLGGEVQELEGVRARERSHGGRFGGVCAGWRRSICFLEMFSWRVFFPGGDG